MGETPSVRYWLSEAARERGLVFSAPRSGDAGYDIRSLHSTVIPPGEHVKLETGLHLAIPVGFVGIVKDRSSMAARKMTTSGGVIDASYRGQVQVLLTNHGAESFHVEAGDRIAQLVVVPHRSDLIESPSLDELGATDRGAGGFGSTGTR
jgi:dUTP pyrophosphatase